jgi:long-chain acyl-CoA synthetase
LLVGDRLPFLTALFTVHANVAESLPGMDSYKGKPAEEVAVAPAVQAEVQKIVSRVNKQLAPFEQVRKFRLLPRDFTIEQGELTATMKVRRQNVIRNFQSDIDALYQGREGSDL